jgi:hypothetical protein
MFKFKFSPIRKAQPAMTYWLPPRKVPLPVDELFVPQPPSRRATLGFLYPSYEGLAKYWVGLATLAGSLYKYRLAFNNLQASTDPGVTDDEADNYAPGSIWVNKSTDEAFVCLSAVSGAAVWWSITALDGGSP